MRWMSRINLLALVAVVLLAVALRYPWWSFDTDVTDETTVYAYRIDGPVVDIIGYRRSRQMTILTGVLVGCVGLALLGTLWRGRGGRVALSIAGLLTLYGSYRLIDRIGQVAARSGIPLQGKTTTWEEFVYMTVVSRIEPAMYLTLAGGVLCLLAALLHNRARLRSE
jgi:hypothetical protein